MINIVLCGGNGTRLWPISRTLMPKQFAKIFNDKSLFQLTIERNAKVCDTQFIISNVDQYFLAYDQLEEINKQNNQYLLEPVGRNTAPAIALACLSLDPQDIVLVTPSDHLIKDKKEYEKVLSKAKELAYENNLVTFGITPTFPETGFGYIEGSGLSDEDCGLNVIAFHEKPNLQTAQYYLDQNIKPQILNSQSSTPNAQSTYYWNSGMFCFKAGIFLDELKKYSKNIYDTSLEAYKNSNKNYENITRIEYDDMSLIPDDSIDYAVMEKSDIVKVVPSDINWSDLGSFDALYEELPKDKHDNTKNKKHIPINSKNNLVYGDERTIATIDVEDLIIVDTADALLVSTKGSSQKVKKVVEKLKTTNTELHNIHLTAHRPWGTYTVLEDTPKYKIKRIVVQPDKRLSLQKHFHRNEHWTIVSGTATVTIEDKVSVLRANESTYIKMGDTHRLSNEGKVPVVMIETQIGDYLGEDDIVRMEDDFKRYEE